ncbi:hypothetical protein PHLGIDRAFT_89753 [Phlebiopsis gigantea 11061_1 CR5-6]|uniref:Domain of unknown function at the cortex 1 domain-containing protein n=1 Tax=Phlebiopsis gigantea (strain 11061_1 CR5-6) TaxID=745531 RepID=A0A0C3SAT7_PHLG1|nr:hypothetical protein PHLGIDRAFT_89753 [Phlebiopsis gigantea 11061_1 CR5-6]
MPQLRFLAGPSFTDLSPIKVNSDVPLHVKSSAFDGKVAVYVKGLADSSGSRASSPYFDHKDRKGITWSIQLQGRFLQTHSADDIIFGNVFDRPLRVPWGFGAALKFMRYVDPSLQEDLASKSRPWAFSPFVATMPHIHHARLDDDSETPSFPAPYDPICENMSQVRTRSGTGRRHDAIPPRHRKQRKVHFRSADRRRDVQFGPNDLITADFCHHYLDFSDDGIVLRLPCGISIDLLRYWDGQPVRFVCAERNKGPSADKQPWGRVLFCIVMQREDEVGLEKASVSYCE